MLLLAAARCAWLRHALTKAENDSKARFGRWSASAASVSPGSA